MSKSYNTPSFLRTLDTYLQLCYHILMNDVTTIREALVTPTEANLMEQLDTFGIEGQLDGKFVRIGNLPLFAPMIDLELPGRALKGPGYEVRTPDHPDIAKAALSDPRDELCAAFIAERDRVVADNSEHRLVKAIFKDKTDTNTLPDWTTLIYPRDGVVDAGTYIFDRNNNTLNVFDDSIAWGAANNAGRLATRELIQRSVGSNIIVTASTGI